MTGQQPASRLVSITPWYEAMCLAFGARPFTIDYNPIISKSARLEVATVAEFERNPISRLQGKAARPDAHVLLC
jgi:hypothetical protein